MSWREVLGFRTRKMDAPTHNTHNTQNPIPNPNCADSADIALRDSEEDSRLLEALSNACCGLRISANEVKNALAPEDIQDWREGKINAQALAAFALLLVKRREMDEGKRPADYTQIADCKQCGPVWLFLSGEVLGCPWCRNRIADQPIPRPLPVSCDDCAYFKRRGRSPLGHCAKGAPEALGGRWGSDRHTCERYIPKKA